MEKKVIPFLFLILCLSACEKLQQQSGSAEIDYEEEIRQVEANFANMATEKGLAEAFSKYIADDGVILRGKSLYRGPAEVKEYFSSNRRFTNVSLDWQPDVIDVAASGDMAYTYGLYYFNGTDTSGNTLIDTGYFHTVWRRQPDGNWKFVWD